MRTSAPTSVDGIEKYLGSGMIRGIGPVYAKKMVKAFGEKVFDIIEAEPDRLREVTGVALSPMAWPLYAQVRGALGRVCWRPRARASSWLSPMANVIHAPAIDRQHLGRDEAGIRLDQESHGGGNVLRRANPTDHGAFAH